MELCDVHGHFLPGMDDGCHTTAEAVQVLKSSYAQGVRKMFATPHYYPVESIADFLNRRENAYNALMEVLEGEAQVPQLCLGAEVAYRPGLGYIEDLDKLCLGRSRYLLLEMPFSPWSQETIRDVRNMCAAGGVIPIIAHVERYLDIVPKEQLQQLLEMNVLVQINAGCLLHPKTRRMGRRMLKAGVVQLLGSDCHNMTNRPPNMGEVTEYLNKKKMENILISTQEMSCEIFCEAVCDHAEVVGL